MLGIYKSKKETLGAEGNEAQWLVLVRHGDRQDYATPEWRQRIQALGRYPRDPPLSTLGHRQARQLGAAAAATLKRRGGTVRVLSSPYLRCLQTITPLCDALDVPLELYPEIAEVLHHPRNVAPPTPSASSIFLVSWIDLIRTPATTRRHGLSATWSAWPRRNGT